VIVTVVIVARKSLKSESFTNQKLVVNRYERVKADGTARWQCLVKYRGSHSLKKPGKVRSWKVVVANYRFSGNLFLYVCTFVYKQLVCLIHRY